MTKNKKECNNGFENKTRIQLILPNSNQDYRGMNTQCVEAVSLVFHKVYSANSQRLYKIYVRDLRYHASCPDKTKIPNMTMELNMDI